MEREREKEKGSSAVRRFTGIFIIVVSSTIILYLERFLYLFLSLSLPPSLPLSLSLSRSFLLWRRIDPVTVATGELFRTPYTYLSLSLSLDVAQVSHLADTTTISANAFSAKLTEIRWFRPLERISTLDLDPRPLATRTGTNLQILSRDRSA